MEPEPLAMMDGDHGSDMERPCPDCGARYCECSPEAVHHRYVVARNVIKAMWRTQRRGFTIFSALDDRERDLLAGLIEEVNAEREWR